MQKKIVARVYIRAGGAGVPAFYTATSVNTPLAEGKEIRTFEGRDYVMEYGLKADLIPETEQPEEN